MLPLIPLAVLAFIQSASCFSCKDQSNKNVDWFMALKMPKQADGTLPGVADGHGFYYMDYNNKKFVASAKPINEKAQAVAYTLQQVYDSKSQSEVFYAMYNDEPATAAVLLDILRGDATELWGNRTRHVFDTTPDFGHTKGVVLFNKQTGIWLVHSVPKFPPPNEYEYPASGATYGQNLLCMTFKYNQLSKIGTQLYYNHPDIYASALPTDIAAENPDLAKAVALKFKSGTPTSSVIDLTTDKGLVFKSFAKTHEFNKDLYEGLVATTLGVGLNVESWIRGDEIALICPAPKYPVYEVQYVKVLTSAQYKYTSDHSKYAVSRSQNLAYVCNGDINRMTSQYKRGGGTVCFRDSYVWGEYNKNLVSETTC